MERFWPNTNHFGKFVGAGDADNPWEELAGNDQASTQKKPHLQSTLQIKEGWILWIDREIDLGPGFWLVRMFTRTHSNTGHVLSMFLLDQSEILSGDLPQVLQSACSPAELVVGVVLGQHDAAVGCSSGCHHPAATGHPTHAAEGEAAASGVGPVA